MTKNELVKYIYKRIVENHKTDEERSRKEKRVIDTTADIYNECREVCAKSDYTGEEFNKLWETACDIRAKEMNLYIPPIS